MSPSANSSVPVSAANPVREHLERARSLLWQVFLFSVLINLLVLTSSIYMMQVFDRVLSSHSTATLFYLTIIAVFALALMALLDLARARVLTRIGTWLEARLSGDGLRRAVDAALMGKDYRTEALRDLGTLRSFLGGAGVITLFDILPALAFFILLYAFHPFLGHLAAVGALLLLGLAVLNDRLTHGPLTKANAESMRALRQADSAMRNAEVLDTMGMIPGLVKRWQKSSAEVLKLQTLASDHAASLMSLSKFLRLVVQVLVLGVGAWLVLRREMTAGQMVAASIIMSRALAPVEQSIGTWRQTIAAQDAYKRLTEMFSRPLLRAHSMALPKPVGNLTAEGVTYIPNGARAPIIRGVSFALKPATVTAVVGPSAAGKSTLARLVVGVYPPTYGNVRLDGADVFLWDRADFGPHVGYLPQDVELFAGTVRDNVARFAEAEPAEVVEAARLAGAHEMILRLPQGYETEIGEAGGLLSGGQRQRLGLARALFRKPQLVVLDEPNSSLDAEGEDALNNAIVRLKQLGATVMVVGHRPTIMQHVDNVIVLRDGRIEMAGSKEEVLPRILPGRRSGGTPPQVSQTGGTPA